MKIWKEYGAGDSFAITGLAPGINPDDVALVITPNKIYWWYSRDVVKKVQQVPSNFLAILVLTGWSKEQILNPEKEHDWYRGI